MEFYTEINTDVVIRKSTKRNPFVRCAKILVFSNNQNRPVHLSTNRAASSVQFSLFFQFCKVHGKRPVKEVCPFAERNNQ